MTRPTTVAFAAALAAHVAVLFGVHPPHAEAPSPKPEEYVEVALYSPPPPSSEPSPQLTDPEPPPAEPSPEPPSEIEPPPPVVPPHPAPITDPIPPPPPPPPERQAKPAPPKPRKERTPAPPSPPSTRPKPGLSAGGASSFQPNTATPGGYQTVGTVSYLHRGHAIYPPEALRKRETGTVTLTLYINEFGTVDSVEVARSSGTPELDAAAVAAERRSTFRPAVLNGRPVKSKARVPYTFELH